MQQSVTEKASERLSITISRRPFLSTTLRSRKVLNFLNPQPRSLFHSAVPARNRSASSSASHQGLQRKVSITIPSPAWAHWNSRPVKQAKTRRSQLRLDNVFEPDETFFIDLSNPTNATIADAQGQATITNDDPQPTVSVAVQTFRTEGAQGTSGNASVDSETFKSFVPDDYCFLCDRDWKCNRRD